MKKGAILHAAAALLMNTGGCMDWLVKGLGPHRYGICYLCGKRILLLKHLDRDLREGCTKN